MDEYKNYTRPNIGHVYMFWLKINLFLAKLKVMTIFMAENTNLMIGRKKEFEKFQDAVSKDRAQLVAVYGRRRVGKTFLINEFFGNKYCFKHTAVSPVDDASGKKKKNLMRIQLHEFYYSMRTYGLDAGKSVPENWFEAFHMLGNLLEKKDNGSLMILFIDELPWMDTPKASFLPAFEHFCNDWVLARKNVKLFVCGSATSWILDKLINNKGGLYGRVTMPVYVSPFNLYECQEFFKAGGFQYDQYDICRAYMSFGGIPYYLDQFRKGFSVAQNIDAILFDQNAPLKDEFDRLFTSQFSRPNELKRIVSVLAGKRTGYTREELIEKGLFSSGGTLSDNLSALEKSKLIESYTPFDSKDQKYKLVDPFCLFYLKYAKKNLGKNSFWQINEKSPATASFMGFAFEDLCFNHIKQIKRALGIEGVITWESSWGITSDSGKKLAQIDMIINRDDRFVSLCEMKFTRGEFEITSSYNIKLQNRLSKVQDILKDKKSIQSVLVTTYGLKRNDYASRFDCVVTLEDLFQR